MTEKFLVGTYTNEYSNGLYEIELDNNQKKLQNLKYVAAAGNPTYLALSKKNRIYSIDKVWGNGDDSVKGGVEVLDNNTRPALTIDYQINEPTSPAYITVDEKRQLVYTANYHTGAVIVYKIQNDGSLEKVDEVDDEGSTGPRPEQDGPHPHYADLTPDGRLVVVDLGQDRVYLYDISDEGKLSLVSQLKLEAGFGPRHIVFDHKKGVAYLDGELSSNVAVLNYDEDKGKLSVNQIISTIPDDWTKHNGAAAIRMSSDGHFIYVSNRGHNSIAVFKSDNEANLTSVQKISTEGDFPRDFNFSKDENFLIVLNQNTNNATLYQRNHQNGKLSLVQKDFNVPEGVCIAPENNQ